MVNWLFTIMCIAPLLARRSHHKGATLYRYHGEGNAFDREGLVITIKGHLLKATC